MIATKSFESLFCQYSKLDKRLKIDKKSMIVDPSDISSIDVFDITLEGHCELDDSKFSEIFHDSKLFVSFINNTNLIDIIYDDFNMKSTLKIRDEGKNIERYSVPGTFITKDISTPHSYYDCSGMCRRFNNLELEEVYANSRGADYSMISAFDIDSYISRETTHLNIEAKSKTY